MPASDLASSVRAMMAFVPAKDFELSKRFYAELGFQIRPIDAGLAAVTLGQRGFLLQNHYVPDWAGNFMFHLLVTNLDAWWEHISSLDLPTRYPVPAPRPPKLESWGLKEVHVIDPAGVLWHFAEEPAAWTTSEPRPADTPNG